MYWNKTPMSWLQALTPRSFHKYNPDWTINVYIPKQIYTGNSKYIPDYTGQDYFHQIIPYVNIIEIDLDDYSIDPALHNILRSDILRYHLLYNHGGVWSDFDVLWLKPMEIQSIALCSFDGIKQHYPIGILISPPAHPFYKVLIDKCNLLQKTLKGKPEHQAYGPSMWKKLFPDTNKLLKDYPDMIKIDYATFYPYSIYNMIKLWETTDLSVITKKTMCVHWFNGHILSKRYLNNNGLVCSMTAILKNEGYV